MGDIRDVECKEICQRKLFSVRQLLRASCLAVKPGLPVHQPLNTTTHMSRDIVEVRDFVATFFRAGKSQKEIKPGVDSAYSDKTLSISQINWIIEAVKEGKNNYDQLQEDKGDWQHRCVYRPVH
jgi:hypothetical protein